MAITTLAGMRAGERDTLNLVLRKTTGTMEAGGVPHSLFYLAGAPAAASAPSPGVNGAALTSYAGAFPWVNPSSGNTYLTKATLMANVPGTLLLCDRLWHNSGLTVTTTTEQAITSGAFPARDRNGSTNGAGVHVAVECRAATTNAAAITNMTLNYTNSANSSPRTATIPSTVAGAGFPAGAAANSFVPFLLAAGDDGVRSIQGVTLGTSLVTGTIHLVAYRVIASITAPGVNVRNVVDGLSLGFPRIYDDSVLFCVWFPNGTTTTTIHADFTIAQG